MRRICFFNDTATTEIYALSLHDALPIYRLRVLRRPAVAQVERLGQDQDRGDLLDRLATVVRAAGQRLGDLLGEDHAADRKSTRLNSSHANISYAVFCLKKNFIRIAPRVV